MHSNAPLGIAIVTGRKHLMVLRYVCLSVCLSLCPRRELYHLQRELLRERTRCKALEEELENPMNIHRWRKLEVRTHIRTYIHMCVWMCLFVSMCVLCAVCCVLCVCACNLLVCTCCAYVCAMIHDLMPHWAHDHRICISSLRCNSILVHTIALMLCHAGK